MSRRRRRPRPTPGRKRRRERGLLRLRAAALRGRRRDGRRAGRRGRLAARRGGAARGRRRRRARGEERVVALIQEANRRVWQRANEDAAASGMGTTITVALVEPDGTRPLRPRRRLARLPAPRREARAADRRPLARRRARPPRRAVAGGGRDAPAALRDHARARHRPRRRRRHLHGRGPRRRRLPDLLRRALDDGRRRRSLERCSSENRDDLDAAAKALVAAANRGGGEDNITAVLFAGRGATTREATRPCARCRRDEPAPHDEDEDTLEGVSRCRARPSTRWSSPPEDAAQLDGAESPPAGRAAVASPAARPARDRDARARDRGARPLGLARAATERAQPRAREPDRRRAADRRSASRAVYIARQSVARRRGLAHLRRVLLRALPRGARRRALSRCRTPTRTCCRWPALLTAVGITEIYRLGQNDALRQAIWIVIGVALFAATLLLLRRDYRELESYKYLFGIGAIVLLLLPALPGIGKTVNGARLWVGVGSLPVAAGRAREDLPDRLPRRLPAREARGARAGAAEGLRAAARDLGRRDARARRDERPRLGAPLLRDLPRDALRRDRPRALRRSGSCSSSPAPRPSTTSSAHVRDRVTIWLHPWTTTEVFCPLTGGKALRQDCSSYQLVKSLYSIGNGGYVGPGFGKGTFTDPTPASR